MSRPNLAVSWLYHHLLEPAVRIVDVRWYLGDASRGRAEYEAAHIPGAIFLDLDTDLSGTEGGGRHPLPDPQAFADVLGAVGIGNDHHVVFYDAGDGGVAARGWWMLRHVGHDQVSVLEGGFAAWRAAEYPVTAAVHTYPRELFQVSVRSDDVVGRDELLGRLGSIVLLDTRTPERYEGRFEPVDPEPGHIPTALSAPYTDSLTEFGFLRAPDKLAERFRSLGVREGRDTVVYCGSGVTACHLILALEVAGIPGAKLYPGSWSDWSTSRYPVATGPEPGSLPG